MTIGDQFHRPSKKSLMPPVKTTRIIPPPRLLSESNQLDLTSYIICGIIRMKGGDTMFWLLMAYLIGYSIGQGESNRLDLDDLEDYYETDDYYRHKRYKDY